MFFKSKKPKESVKKDPNLILADFNEKKGDWYNAFYFRHKEEIDAWDNLITASRTASKTPDKILQLTHLRESLSLLDGFKEWCSQFEKGDAYFNQHCATGERSLYARVTQELSALEKK